ncbi:hypothetical protein BC832DRAFT_189579 [Gaertneriomyces semiglobifer]|nr:hypothetical protein BC832DRAFT_189579 [Gaertneriomyces semiglobifer]
MMWYIQDQMNTLLDERLQDIQGDHSEERSESHRPDFALWGAGAEYIPSLTTQTYTPSMRSTLLSSFFSWLRSPIPIKSPVIALNEGTNPGECWPMKGSAGSLGVYLAADVVIDSVTLAHVPKSKWTSPKSGRSAPKEFEVWSVWDIEHFLRLNKDLETARHPIIVEGRRPPAVLLASGRFDPGTRDKEVFVVTEEAKRVTRHVFNHFGAGTSVIVLRILSNHGHPDYTCLYRISVHGHSVEGLLAQDEESGNVDM